MTRREVGDRSGFLGRLERRLTAGVPDDPARPIAPAPAPLPRATPRPLDPGDLLGSFVRAAEAVHTRVHLVRDDEARMAALAGVVRDAGIRTAVVSPEPTAAALRCDLEALGVAVHDVGDGVTAEVDVGITAAVAGVAATGSVVLDAAATRSRSLWLLPPTHVVVLDVDAIVASPATYLRDLGRRPPLPSNLCLVTGPSRSGDIEQIIVEGVHGPTAVHVLVQCHPAPPTIPHRPEPTGLDDPRCPTPEGDP